MELLGSAVRRKNGFGGFGGCERRRKWRGAAVTNREREKKSELGAAAAPWRR
jgi:hypothetical protein